MIEKLTRKIEQLKINWEFSKAKRKLKKDPLMGLDLNKIKSQYGKRFIELRTLINSVDPMNLINMGAPQDEYEPEVKTIIVQLETVTSKEDVLAIIFSEFCKWFGNAGNKEDYIDLAETVFQWIEKQN